MATHTDSRSSASPHSDTSFSDDAQAKAQEAADRLHDQARETFEQTQDRVREQLAARSVQLGERISTHASDLRSVSGALRDQGQDGAAQAADRAAGYAEQAGSYLQDNDVDRILSDAESLSRRRPGVVAAGALAAGFAASRFLKSSSSRRYAASRGPEGPSTPSPRTSVLGSGEASTPPATAGPTDGVYTQTDVSPVDVPADAALGSLTTDA